jgi:hypothetical protein
MIDITTIQTFPVAPALTALQATNSSISETNKQLKTALAIIAIAGGIYFTYRLIKKYNEDKQRAENQLPRD